MAGAYAPVMRSMKRGWEVPGVAAVTFGVVAALWVGVGLLAPRFLETAEGRGQWGDSFGAVGALFTGLALAGVVIALYFQSRDLELQRSDLALTRKEMTKQRAVMAEQLQSIRGQRLESTLFAMLRMHREVVEGLALKNGMTGRPALHALRLEMEQRLVESDGSSEPWARAQEACGAFARTNYIHLGHYFRLSEELLQFLASVAPSDDTAHFAPLVRAHLSLDDLMLLLVWMTGWQTEDASLGEAAQLAERFGIFSVLDFGYIDRSPFMWIKTAWHDMAVATWGSERMSFGL